MMPAHRSGPPAARTPDHPRPGLRPSVPLVILVLVPCVAPASARQTTLTPAAARVLGFDVPPAPQIPQSPVLQGGGRAFDARPLDSTPLSVPPQLRAAPRPATPPASMVPSAPDTWDQTAEHLAMGGSGHQPNDVVDAVVWQAWGTASFVALAAAMALLLVVSPLNRGRRGRRPASIVRAGPPHSPAHRVDRPQSVESDRRQPAGGTDRSPPARRVAGEAVVR
jgi:hypothetical protein